MSYLASECAQECLFCGLDGQSTDLRRLPMSLVPNNQVSNRQPLAQEGMAWSGD
jgi:hypothetical protein